MSSLQRGVEDIFEKNGLFYEDDLTTYQEPHIRVLSIEPGQFRDPICCRIRSVPLNTELVYRGLSYAWGTRSYPKTITLNGKTGFTVTDSLFGGLRRLRQVDEARDLWVDAICINQTSIAERSAQVAIMAAIFTSAELVYIWLGPCGHARFSDAELEDCERHYVSASGTVEFAGGPAQWEVLCASHGDTKNHWWWRVWAIQEFALANSVSVLVGPHQMTWRDFYNANNTNQIGDWDFGGISIEISESDIQQQLDMLDHVKSSLRDGNIDLHFALEIMMTCEASDIRDKVYGVLGLAGTNLPAPMAFRLTPDYHKSFSRLCQDVTLSCIQSQQSFDILFGYWERSSTPPCWVVDFARPRQMSPLVRQRSRGRHARRRDLVVYGNSSGQNRGSARVVGEYLVARCITIATVEMVAGSDWDSFDQVRVHPRVFVQGTDKARNVYEKALASIAQAADTRPERATGNTRSATDGAKANVLFWLEELANNVTAKTNSELRVPRDAIDTEEQFGRTVTMDSHLADEHYTRLREHQGELHPFEFHNVAEHYRRLKPTFSHINTAFRALQNRKFFVTAGGLCGVGSADTCVGDIVAILLGCSVPVVLRPTGNEDEYKIVSECFVSGIMYGELIPMYEQGKLDAKDFFIV